MAEIIEQATAAPGEVRQVYVKATRVSPPDTAGWYVIVSDDGDTLVLRRVK